ncbi:MAG: glycosyl transferase family 2, partial [Planctomycetes bacterium]|nr:glycosyl transferase family 2 [Planctomycetota bacterium]
MQGKRVLLDEIETRKAIASESYWPSIFTKGLDRRRHAIRLPFLLPFGTGKNMRGIRSCNFGVWRTDALMVNGFDEQFFGWGREDDD